MYHSGSVWRLKIFPLLLYQWYPLVGISSSFEQNLFLLIGNKYEVKKKNHGTYSALRCTELVEIEI